MRKNRRWVLWGMVAVGFILFAVIVTSYEGRVTPNIYSLFGNAPGGSAKQDFLSSSGSQTNVSDIQVQGTPEPAQNRIVLKNATISITVNDPSATIGTISKMATDMNGWVVTSNTYQSANSSGTKLTYGNVTIRVPADKLDSALDQIKSAAISVDSLNVTGEDVTEQYTDLNSQLTNLQTAEDDLRKIMDSATKTEDVLAVYQQLTNIRGQIDVITGKIKFYDQSAAYSSIAVTLSPSADNTPIEIGGWQPGNTLKNALEALIHLGQGLIDVLIWLIVVILPFALLFGIVAYIAYRIYRRVKPRTAHSSQSGQPPVPDEASSV